MSPRMAMRFPAPRDVGPSPGCCDCRSFSSNYCPKGGWSSREDTVSRANLRVRRSFLLVLWGDRAEIFRLFLFNGEEGQLPGLVHVIDDDASFRTAVARRLKLAGYDVETYSSAQQLLDRLPDAETPGCILLDVQMPGLSGLELQSRLIERGSTMPIVFVTGYADTPTTLRAVKASPQDFLTKPASSEQLIDAIERAMARYDSARHQHSELGSFRRLVATLTPRDRQA